MHEFSYICFERNQFHTKKNIAIKLSDIVSLKKVGRLFRYILSISLEKTFDVLMRIRFLFVK